MKDEEKRANSVDLGGMTKAQLLSYAEESGVPGVSSRMTKAQIIETIEGGAE